MDAIIFLLFGHFPMDGPKRFKYTTCTKMHAFMTVKKKSLFHKYLDMCGRGLRYANYGITHKEQGTRGVI